MRQLGRADILLDLLGLGGAGDDARHLRAPRQPADGELEQGVAALGGEPFEALDNRPIVLGQIARRGRAACSSAGRLRAAAHRAGICRSTGRWPAAQTGSGRGHRPAAPASSRDRAGAPAGCTPPGTRRNGGGRDAAPSTAPRRPARPAGSSSRCSGPCPDRTRSSSARNVSSIGVSGSGWCCW